MNQRSSTGRPVRGAQNQLWPTTIFKSPILDRLRKSLRMFDDSSRRRPDAGSKGQCIDMGIIYVNKDESSDTSWRRLQ